MKLIAHRGWASGGDENTLAAFRRAAAEPNLAGVELDLRRGDDGRLVVSHDRPGSEGAVSSFDEVVRFLASTGLGVFVELKDPGIEAETMQQLAALGLSHRAVIFGFPEVLQPIVGDRPVRFGVIARYPWQIRRLVLNFRPDVIMLGWDEREWTRLAFRAWWSVFSLRGMGRRFSAEVVVGTVGRGSDLRWLRNQGIEAAVVDMDAI